MGDGEGDEAEPNDEDLEMPIFPISYYERKSKEGPPKSIQEFLNDNYKFLAIAGVFGAVVVYLSELAFTPGRQIIIGMVGGAIMFIISFLVVINNGIIEFARAYESKSLGTAALHIFIIYAMIFIASSLASFFTRYPTASFEALDTLGAVTMVIIFVLIIRARFTIPIELDTSSNYELSLGRITYFIANKSLRIAAVLLFILGLASLIPKMRFLALSNYVTFDSDFIQILVISSIFLLTAVIIFSSAIIIRIIYLKLKKLWDIVA